jgi:hypothetical protein
LIVRVQKYLPPAIDFGIDLHDGERDVLRIGLLVDSVLRVALSGAEWSAVTAALSAAVVDSQPMISKTSPVIIAPEDRDFDPKMLRDVMASFSAIDAQVIMTGTKEPIEPVGGWTVIRLGVDSSSFCVECMSEIIAGPCPHGIGKPAPRVIP